MSLLLVPVQEMTYQDKIAHMFDWNMDASMYSSLIIMLIILILALIVGIKARIALKKKEYLERPHGILFLADAYVEFCMNFAKDKMGDSFEDMGGYFMTLFAYLFVAFNWGLTGLPSVIDWLAAPLSLSIIMFTLIQFTALRYQHWGYFHRYIEPFVVFLPINLVTMWTPIVSTCMRMFGNCLSGTIIIGLLQWALGRLSQNILASWGAVSAASIPPYTWASVFLAPIPMGILNLYFSLFSGFVQTTVFSTLTALWIAQEKPEEESPSLTNGAPKAVPQE
jgi:F-type H+-transporting ATPase subunit a